MKSKLIYRALIESGIEGIIDQKEALSIYGSDQSEVLAHLPDLAVCPSNVEALSQIMKICHEHQFPVTVRGAGTGLCGGAIPVYGGLVIDMKHFNKILKIDTNNLQVITESAVITEHLQNCVAQEGLFYPPNPSSSGSSFIGGNIATNAGGPKALKYGVVRDYVLNLEVVLADGSVIWTGANTLKNSTGYNLTQLITGSEGTLCIITKAVLKLIPLPKFEKLMLVTFNTSHQATLAINAIFMSGITPSCLEYMDQKAVRYSIEYGKESYSELNTDAEAFLLIELDGNRLQQLSDECEKIYELLENYDIDEVYLAEDQFTKNKFWNLRKQINPALKNQFFPIKKADTVVPRASMIMLIEEIYQLASEMRLIVCCYGHAGDGNIHVNVLCAKNSNFQSWEKNAALCIEKIFKRVVELEGTISGEHGIAYLQKKHLSLKFDPMSLSIMKKIKASFDPLNILNPGKII